MTSSEPNRSAYCDYNASFKHYDQIRQPNGIKEILAALRRSGIPLARARIMDGGFGTGAFIDRARHSVGEIVGVEGSREGFRKARARLGDDPKVQLQLGDILSLPFPDASFDGYVVNQVLHHLDTESSFPMLGRFLKEARRVLRPGGVLVINTCSQAQLDPDQGVFWNYAYVRSAALQIRDRYIPINALNERLLEAGFDGVQTGIPSDRVFQERYYTDPSFALEAAFMQGDSVYALLTGEEIREAQAAMREAIADGSVNQVLARAAAEAERIGEAVILSALSRP